jgi:hypothetical protein
MNTVTSGNRNGKLYKISYISTEYTSYYELSVYDRNSDSFVQQGENFNSIQEAEQYLTDLYGTHN